MANDIVSASLPLGRLERVSLRKCWPREDVDFTPWLAREENIKLLADAIEIELEVESVEKPVGSFSADLFCKDTATDAWVVIENQIQRTDHKHLGQLLTYAAGLGAVTIVWIAERFTDEHRAALDWLNASTREGIDFFGLEIELWRIGDSPAAPKFNVVAKPNDWRKRVAEGGSSRRSGELTPTQQMQLDFWTEFHDYLKEHSTTVKPGKPSSSAWMNVGMGGRGFVMNAVATVWDSEAERYGSGELRVDVVMNRPNAKGLYAALETMKQSIDEQIGEPAVWYNPDNAKVCRIYVRRSADLGARASWPSYFAWLAERLDRMYRIFVPIAKDLEQMLHDEGMASSDAGDRIG